MIYLDYSANTPVSEDVLRCFVRRSGSFGNPNSTHDAGKAAKERMDEITVSIAGLMGLRRRKSSILLAQANPTIRH